MRFAVLVFPGTWSERDCQYVLEHELGQQADLVWHREANLDAYDAVVIPGGFSYGDHLRTGAIARFSPVMEAVTRHAEKGKPVIGICNGFQILCESHLLPGALMRNDSAAMAAAVSDEMIDTFAAAGTADEVRKRIAPYLELADTICLTPPDQLIDPAESDRYREALLEAFAV